MLPADVEEAIVAGATLLAATYSVAPQPGAAGLLDGKSPGGVRNGGGSGGGGDAAATVAVPGVGPKPSVLKDANGHERDDRLVFQRKAHVYLVDAVVQCKISVTELVATFFEKFEPVSRPFQHHFQLSLADLRAACEQICGVIAQLERSA
jgi:hypothetical protein